MKLKREEALEILELEVDGVFPTETEIKKQYRSLAMKWHPDKNHGNEDEAKVAFQRVHAAYQLLLKGPDYDSDEEEFDDMDDMDMEEAFACFMEVMSQMGHKGRGGVYFAFGGGGFAAAGPVPDFMGRGGSGGRGMPGFGPQPGRGRPAFFEEVSDEDDDYYDSDEDDEADDGGEYQYYKAQQQRERARQESQERERQRRAEELRARQQEQRTKLTEEERRKNEERLEAEAKARALAQETEMLRKLISQLPRPTMAERTETSITLSMARLAKATGDNQLPKGCRWEMEMRAQSEPTWHCIHSSSSTSTVTAKDLIPGTKYVFRARAGRKVPDGAMEWGKYSDESFYATMGRQPAPSAQPSGQTSADAGQPGQSKKGRRREAASRKEQQQPQSQKSGEVDMDEAKRRLKAEKEKEAAVKAAMERAAADYHRETEQLAAQKADTEAKLAEKVRRSRMKARRKEEAVEPAPKGEEAASQPPPPPPPPQAPKPPERDLNDYADAFGSVRRIDAHQTSNGFANGGWYAPEDEELSLEEAIQLSLALEESERYAKEEAVMRGKLQYNETSFPSLGGGSSNDDWGVSDFAQPQPTANLGPVKQTSAPPAPSNTAPPPAAPYRESKRAPVTPQPSPGGFYPSGNARMAPPQMPPVRVSPPAAVPPVPPVPRSMASPQPSPRGVHPAGNGRNAPNQAPPMKAPPLVMPPIPRSAGPPPPQPRPHGKPSMMANGQGVYTEDDVIRQSHGPPGMQTNGVHHRSASSQEAPLQHPGAAVPQRSAVPNGHASGRPRYNPLNSGPTHQPNGTPSGYTPPPVSARAAGAYAEPMAALFPHLFPNSAV